MHTALFLALALSGLSHAQGANVLLISTVVSLSHSFWFDNLASILTEAGHKVTVLSTQPPKLKGLNVTLYLLEGGYDYLPEIMDMEGVSRASTPFDGIDQLYNWSKDSCKVLLHSKTHNTFKEDMKRKGKKPFDLIVHDGANCECFLGWVHEAGRPPLISATAFGTPYGLRQFAGNPEVPSVVPHMLAPFSSSAMTFYNRVYNTLIEAYARRWFFNDYLPDQNVAAREFFGTHIPPVEEIAKNATLFLVNSHPAIDDLGPLADRVVPVGGIQLTQKQIIDKDLKGFLDGAKEGAILVSFGSNVLCSWMSQEKLNIFLKTFEGLNKRVIWKCDAEGLTPPPNVRIAKWTPQKEILGHPNIKLFITHGGLLSFHEAMYSGVPLIVIPFMVDQHPRARKVENDGLGIKLFYYELKSSSQLTNAIQTVLNDPKYLKNAKDVSRIFKPFVDSTKKLFLSLVDRTLETTDIPIKRPSAADISWYQYLLLDVLALLGALSLLFLVTTLYIFKTIVTPLFNFLWRAQLKRIQKKVD